MDFTQFGFISKIENFVFFYFSFAYGLPSTNTVNSVNRESVERKCVVWIDCYIVQFHLSFWRSYFDFVIRVCWRIVYLAHHWHMICIVPVHQATCWSIWGETLKDNWVENGPNRMGINMRMCLTSMNTGKTINLRLLELKCVQVKPNKTHETPPTLTRNIQSTIHFL